MAQYISQFDSTRELDNYYVPGADGWFLFDILITYGNGLKMAVFARYIDDTNLEYAIVNRGSTAVLDWLVDAAYIVNGVAPDVVVSMIKAIEFVNSHAGSEITMVGHSKGGYEAIMNALVTDTNCITFNVLSPFNSGSSIAMYIELLSARYTKRMTHYVVAGEIAFVGNSVFGSNYGNPAWSTVVYLLGPHPAWNTFANHGMDSVAIALGGTPLELYPAKPVPYTAPPVPGVRPSITPPPPTPKPTPTPNYNPPSIPGQPVPGARPW